MWVIHTQVKEDMFIPTGTVVLIYSVSLDLKKCFIDRAYNESYAKVSIFTNNLEGFRPVEVSDGYRSGMQFGSEKDANEYVKRLIRPFIELPQSAKRESIILIANGEYTDSEMDALLGKVSAWNSEYRGAKLVLSGDFEIAYTEKIESVEFKEEVKVEMDNDRLEMILGDITD